MTRPNGTLLYEKLCASCGFAMVTEDRQSPDGNDRYEMELHSPSCGKCPPKKVVTRPKRPAIGRLHSFWHWLQEDIGGVSCVTCHVLLSNRFRPVAFSLAKSASVARDHGSLRDCDLGSEFVRGDVRCGQGRSRIRGLSR